MLPTLGANNKVKYVQHKRSKLTIALSYLFLKCRCERDSRTICRSHERSKGVQSSGGGGHHKCHKEQRLKCTGSKLPKSDPAEAHMSQRFSPGWAGRVISPLNGLAKNPFVAVQPVPRSAIFEQQRNRCGPNLERIRSSARGDN